MRIARTVLPDTRAKARINTAVNNVDRKRKFTTFNSELLEKVIKAKEL